MVEAAKPPKVIRKHRKIDKELTLAKYAERIACLPDEAFDELEGAWLSTFKVYNNLVFPCETVPTRMVCNATILATESLKRGVQVYGVTSQRKKSGKFVCATLPTTSGEEVDREECKIVYVGAYSYFTGNSAHPIFSLQKSDKIRV